MPVSGCRMIGCVHRSTSQRPALTSVLMSVLTASPSMAKKRPLSCTRLPVSGWNRQPDNPSNGTRVTW